MASKPIPTIDDPPDTQGPIIETRYQAPDDDPDAKQCRLCRGTGTMPIWSGVVGNPDYQPCRRCNGRGFVPLFGDIDIDTGEE